MRPRVQNEQPTPSGPRFHFVSAIIFTLAAVGLWIYLNRNNIQEYMDAQHRREAARESIAQIEERIGLLQRQQQSLAYNGVESEKQIRERLQMHKPGEKVVFFVNEGDNQTTVINGFKDPTSVTVEKSDAKRGPTEDR